MNTQSAEQLKPIYKNRGQKPTLKEYDLAVIWFHKEDTQSILNGDFYLWSEFLLLDSVENINPMVQFKVVPNW